MTQLENEWNDACTADAQFHTDSTTSRNRIDYIWMSQSILFNLLNSELHITELYSSDHKLLFVQLLKDGIFDNPARAALKQSNIFRTVFLYNTVEPVQWKTFATHTNSKAFALNSGTDPTSLV